MDYRLLLLSLATVSSVLAAPAWNDRSNDRPTYRDYDYNGGREEYERARDERPKVPVTHTYPSRMQCDDFCANLCLTTNVYLEDGTTIPMYSCDKLKPPKQAAPFFQTLKGNSFYLSLFVIGVIVVGILILLTMCFCCNYCCRNPSSAESSRGSSKQALAHNEDGEFKEYLNGNGNGNGLSNGHHHHHDDIGAMKRERDFARRPRPVPQIV